MFTVTVKAKETATTEAPAVTTTQAPASADATTQAPQQDSSKDASGNSLKGVSLSTTSPKVGEVVKVILDPTSATDVKSYKWLVDGKEASGEAAATYTVTKNDLGKTLKVVVTTTDGKNIESGTTAAVREDNSMKVEIEDTLGLQADGTAVVGDILRVTFGNGLGKLTEITWWINDTFAASRNETNGGLANLTYTPDRSGDCYVVLKNTEGQEFKSNVISIVATPSSAKMSNVSIVEDYSNKANITVDKTSSNFVVSVTLNRADYTGKFYLIDSSKSDYTTNNCVTTSGELDTSAVNNNGVPVNFDVVQKASELTEAKVLGSAKKALGYMNETTKEVTYMFKVKTALTRGTSYKLIFDQDEVTADNLSTTANKTANVSDAVAAPYLKAPTSLKVTAVSDITDNAGLTKATFYTGSSGDATADWLGVDLANVLTVDFYADGNYDGANGKKFDGNNSTNTITAGVASGQYASGSNGIVTVYAVATSDAGVFGKDKLSLTSSPREIPHIEPCASIVVGSVKGSADALSVTINGQNIDGTVYLVSGPMSNIKGVKAGVRVLNDGTASSNGAKTVTLKDGNDVDAANVATTMKYLESVFDSGNDKTYVSKAVVPKTAGKYTFTKIMKGLSENQTNALGGDVYGAIFVPSADNYKTLNSVSNGDCASYNLKLLPTTYAFAGFTNMNVNADGDLTTNTIKLTAKDQFGANYTDPLPTELNGGLAMKLGSDTSTDIGVGTDDGPTITIDGDGEITLDNFDDGVTVKSTDSWKLTTTYGTFTLTVNSTGNTGVHTGNSKTASTATFDLTFTAK